MRLKFYLAFIALAGTAIFSHAETHSIRKLEDIVIYKDAKFHSAFPSIVRRPDGELIVAFRRAPDWRPLGAKKYTHTDPNSYLVSVRSRDDGKTWSDEPKLIYADPFGGSQDPCLLQLKDGSMLCATYGWSSVSKDVFAKLKKPIFGHDPFIFMGGQILHSTDGGNSWEKPIMPPPSKNEERFNLFGNLTPAYNRGAMCEGKDGRIFWVVASHTSPTSPITSTHLMISKDKGKTWGYSCPVAEDEKITFNESSVYETPKGDLVAFMRTADFDDKTCVARSTDGGKSFQKWEDAGFQGHPHFALRLPDQRVLLIYGFRHAPLGIRARVLDPECKNFSTAKEIILRDDGGSVDLGYPWATMISKNRALIVYYFNQADGTRYIAGTFLAIE
jgi:sialidase-1